MSTAPPNSDRRPLLRSIGVRWQVFAVGMLGLITAVVMGVVALVNVGNMRAADEELQRLETLSGQVQAARFGNVDTNG